MPRAARLRRTAALGGIVANGKKPISGFVAVALFASPHRCVTGSIEERWQSLLFQVRRTEPLLNCLRRSWQMPDSAATHDHVARGSANRADIRPHVVGTVEDHALARQAVDVRCLERRLWVVTLQI